MLLSVSLLATAWGQPDKNTQGTPGGAKPGAQGEAKEKPEGAGMPEGGMPEMQPTPIAPAIYIDNGQYMQAKSKPADVTGGKVTGDAATGIKLVSKDKDFSGLYVKGGKSVFTLADSTIELYGDGSMEGSTVGAIAEDGATLILRNDKVTTNGLRSSAIIAQNRAMLKVFDSTIRSNGGTPPAGVKFPDMGPGALGAPKPLLLEGNARDTLVMNRSEAYYYHSKILSEGWGALSTDAVQGYVYLEANDCDIETVKQGYGTYADYGATVVINDSRMHNGRYSGVIAGAANLTLNNVTATSGFNHVMIHVVGGAPTEVGKLTIKGGSAESGEAAIYIKSANADITLEKARLTSKTGMLIQSIVNEDANRTKVNGQKVPGIQVTLKDEKLEGNISHEDTERGMTLNFKGSTLKGTIKNASLTLDAGSKWTATGNSTVTLLGKVKVATNLDAPSGVTITAVAGKDSLLNDGSYNLSSGGVLIVGAN
jgi:hypothetical protein